jgi:cytochrome c oxidase cbb3-type subunit 3
MKLARTLVQALLLAFLLGLMTSMARAEEPALLTVRAPNKGMEEAIHDLLQSISAHNYTFVRQQSIDNRLVPQAWEAAHTRIVYFCNFAQMNRALTLDARATEFLPCRVTLFQTRDGIEMVAINPAWVSERLNNPALHPDCLKLKQDYLDIMNEAAL